jgi:primosomal protein N'
MNIKGHTTKDVKLDELKKGDRIRVTFGSLGSQAAVVSQTAKNGKHGQYIKAIKLAASTGRWSKPRQVYQHELIGKVV